MEYKPEVSAFSPIRNFLSLVEFQGLRVLQAGAVPVIVLFLQHVPMYVFREVAAKCQIFEAVQLDIPIQFTF